MPNLTKTLDLTENFTFQELSKLVREFAKLNGIKPNEIKINLDAGYNNVYINLEANSEKAK